MLEGWPESCRSLPIILRHFWLLKDDLGIENSCNTGKGSLFIPAVLRSNCLQKFHNGHPGITKIQLRVCTNLYWPTINKEIANHMNPHVPCQTISNSQQKEQAGPMDVLSMPWKPLGMDFFLHNSKWHLLLADCYSKFLWVQKISDVSRKDVIFALIFLFFSTW